MSPLPSTSTPGSLAARTRAAVRALRTSRGMGGRIQFAGSGTILPDKTDPIKQPFHKKGKTGRDFGVRNEANTIKNKGRKMFLNILLNNNLWIQ